MCWSFFFFFFSSRRRHTRCSRDWSSDVCSSDLAACTASASSVERDCSTVLMVTSVTRGRQCPRRWVGVWGAATLSGIGRTGEGSGGAGGRLSHTGGGAFHELAAVLRREHRSTPLGGL